MRENLKKNSDKIFKKFIKKLDNKKFHVYRSYKIYENICNKFK